MRRRGPGLIGVAARTAVVAGTATAVSGRVARRQQAKYVDEQQAAAPPPPPPAPAAEPSADEALAASLRQLAELHDQGILSDDEFAAKKAQILGI
jgi:putative oligomerization/nucleic acid binding protein